MLNHSKRLIFVFFLSLNYLIHTSIELQVAHVVILLSFLYMWTRDLWWSEDIVEESGDWIVEKLWSGRVVVTIKSYYIFIALIKNKQIQKINMNHKQIWWRKNKDQCILELENKYRICIEDEIRMTRLNKFVITSMSQ